MNQAHAQKFEKSALGATKARGFLNKHLKGITNALVRIAKANRWDLSTGAGRNALLNYLNSGENDDGFNQILEEEIDDAREYD